jgi:cation transport regulator ChaB
VVGRSARRAQEGREKGGHAPHAFQPALDALKRRDGGMRDMTSHWLAQSASEHTTTTTSTVHPVEWV